jgi:hypothetical protein
MTFIDIYFAWTYIFLKANNALDQSKFEVSLANFAWTLFLKSKDALDFFKSEFS